MLAQNSFSTVNRQGYINAGIRAAAIARARLAIEKSLFIGIKGPNSSGKSLFLDAIVHELADALSSNQLPHSDCMMLESTTNEAVYNPVHSVFNVKSQPTLIDFSNLPEINLNNISLLKALAKKDGLHLFSMQGFYTDYGIEALFSDLPMAVFNEIHFGGHGLIRDWTSWRRATPELKRVRG
jgi:ABC-type uncharacterized transport system ATPase component